MSVEWVADSPKFRYDGVYTPDDFKYRCAQLMQENDLTDRVRWLLAVYVGWAGSLSIREHIRWGRLSNGCVAPYVRRGSRFYLPDGEYSEVVIEA